MKIFVLSAHPDDAEIGCGGTIAKFVEDGHAVFNYVFTLAEKCLPFDSVKRIEEFLSAASRLGMESEYLPGFDHRLLSHNSHLLDTMINLKKDEPDMVLCPARTDIHQDHQAITNEAIRAFKHTTLLGYEMLWNSLSINTQCFVKLQERHIVKKVKAIQEYKSWNNKRYFEEDSIVAFAKARGVQAGCELAETFEVIRLFY